jgi:hypothetical protein
MRVVCPFTDLWPETEAALRQYAPHAEFIDVSGSVYAYWELLRDLWAEGRDFLVVEHDVVIRAGVIDELESCPEWFCAFAYPYRAIPSADIEILKAPLGCTRYRSQLMVKRPELFAGAPLHWEKLNALVEVSLLRGAVCLPHTHLPPVAHHHV